MSRRKINVLAVCMSDAPVVVDSPEWEALRTEYQQTVDGEASAYLRRARVMHALLRKDGVVTETAADGQPVTAVVRSADVAAIFGVEASVARQGKSSFSTLLAMGFNGTDDDSNVTAHDVIRGTFRRVGGRMVKWADGTITGGKGEGVVSTRKYVVEAIAALPATTPESQRADALRDLVAYAAENVVEEVPDPVQTYLDAVQRMIDGTDAFLAEGNALSKKQREWVTTALAQVGAALSQHVDMTVNA